jgi:eukaryotic-like serine/threonine-protein kinase
MADPGQPLPPCPHCRAAHPEDVLICPNTNRMLPLEGRLIDSRFRFVRKLGEGGMSTVWMAENFRVRKRVAIKLMHPEYARNPRTLHRFQNEATAAGRIGNPHICDILDFGESPLGPYIVMEMLTGQSFAELLESQGRIDPPLAVLIIREALKGLSAAHAVGIVHRDLKPENVFLHEPEPGRMLVKLMDFGISKFTEDPGGGRTGANVVMGTPEYMSPEQAAGAANCDARTDIWAMGVMLYRAIAGIEPFRGKTMAALLLALSTEEPEPLLRHVPHLPPGLAEIVARCLAKDPEHRFATAEELYLTLAPFQQLVAEGERPIAPVRTGKTMAISLADMPGGLMPGVTAGVTTGPMSYAPRSGTVDVGAPTGPAPTLPASAVPSATPSATQGTHLPLAQQLPTNGSNPGAQRGGAGTWSSELDPNLAQSEESWSMGRPSFGDDERPDRRSGGGWMGWLIGLGVVALIGGGFGLAWALGAFEGKPKIASGDEGGDETGVVAAEGAGPRDLAGETGNDAGAGETSGETGAPASAEGPDDEGAAADEADDAGDDAADDAGDDSSDAPSTTGGGSSTTGGGSSTTGGGSSTTGGGSTPPRDPPFEPSRLVRSGTLYAPSARGPNNHHTGARNYCRSLARSKRHGLSQWRLPTVAELQSFRNTNIDKLLYWSSEVSGTTAKTVMLMSGKVDDRNTSDKAPRTLCVSRR